MNYFTPDLLSRVGSENDDIAEAAHAEWEEAILAYQKHLKTIKLPPSARHFVKSLCLHDATLKTITVNHAHMIIWLTLELDEPNNPEVLLRYDLEGKPELIKHPQLQGLDRPVVWLYDEFDVKESGRQKLFTHSVLFTTGSELQLVFSKMDVEGVQSVEPTKMEILVASSTARLPMP